MIKTAKPSQAYKSGLVAPGSQISRESLKKPKRRFMKSLSKRIILAMVVVGFLSGSFGGLVYQGLTAKIISDALSQADEGLQNYFITQINSSPYLNESQKEQGRQDVITSFQTKKPFTNLGTTLVLVIKRFFWIVGLVAILAALLAGALGWGLTRRLVGPLEKLRFASQQVATGDFSGRVPVGKNDEVGQVAYSFNFMAQQLQDAEAKRRQLLSDVSHELKTPLASIQGHIEALRDNLPQAKANPQAIYEIVLEDVAELDRMVGSLRTWLNAQSELERLEPESLNLEDELGGLVERFQPRAASAHIKLNLQLDKAVTSVLADRNGLRHIISNLLDNALRYTPAAEQVNVRAWSGDSEWPNSQGGGWVTIAVADTGCGIAPEHWPHLFERFYRIDRSRTRDTGGTGLGLAIVRELVQAQGGRVWLNSRVGQGTIFYVTLPSNA